MQTEYYYETLNPSTKLRNVTSRKIPVLKVTLTIGRYGLNWKILWIPKLYGVCGGTALTR